MKHTSNSLLVASITLQAASTEPLYQQLLQQLRQLIVDGRLSPGYRLPSSRQLALDLQVSRTTSINAYHQLQAEGFLVSRQGAGVYVNQQLPKQSSIQPVPTNAVANIKPEQKSPQQVSFNAGPDVAQFPFPLWAKCLAKVWRRPEPSLLHDLHIGGYLGLRQTLCQYLFTMRGLECEPQQIVITAGQRDSLSLIDSVLLHQGDRVLMEDPGYALQREVIRSLGLKPVFSAVDSQGMALPLNDSVANKLVIMSPSQQYPLGTVMSGPRKLAWLNYANTHNCWLLEDDYDSEFVYDRRRTDALMSLDKFDKVILMGSFSKLMFHGFRLGYLVLPKHLTSSFLHVQEQIGGMASLHIQPALSQFLSERSFISHLKRMRSLYQHRRNYLCQLIEQHLHPWLTAEPPEAGMHLVAQSRVVMDDLAIAASMQQHGFILHALSKHYHHHQKSGFVLGFSGCNEQQLEENVRALKRVLEHWPALEKPIKKEGR